MNLYYGAIGLTVSANIIYHLCQKGINPTTPPIISLIATYSVALVGSLIALPFFVSNSVLVESFRSLNWASYGLGIGILALEMGFLLAYRSGWNLSTAALYSNVAVAFLLVPMGLLIFKENLYFTNWIGMGLALLAITLLSRK